MFTCSQSPSLWVTSTDHAPLLSRRNLLLLIGGCAINFARSAQAALPTEIPAGTALVIADQNEALQTVMIASGEHAKLSSRATYANFLGGPAILEAFRAGALDLASVGNMPPIQAQAAGDRVPIVAALRSSGAEYGLAVRPGLAVSRLEELRGKRIAYGEGTGRQPFILNALKLAELSRKDVTLVPLRAADFPDAVRSGQVDVAALNEPHYSRYLAAFADRGASALPQAEQARLPRGLAYLYASGAALSTPAKTAAIAEFVTHWKAAIRWSKANRDAWIEAYYVKRQRLSPQIGQQIEDTAREVSFPLLRSVIEEHQATADLIYAAGDLPRKLDVRDEFDLRFDEVIAAYAPPSRRDAAL